MKMVVENPVEVAKRMLYLAYQSTSVFGEEMLHHRSEKDVWNNVTNSGDYKGVLRAKPNSLYADVVFGRLVKLPLSWGDNYVEASNAPVEIESNASHVTYTYPSWAKKAYIEIARLFEAALESLKSPPGLQEEV